MTPEEIMMSAVVKSVIKKIGPENTVILLSSFIIKICSISKTEGCTVRFPLGETVTIDINMSPVDIQN